ncbi:hypothetical protein DOY81_000957 [Sarcophaga bullata]|nr:hypothetical protein DOY81_000957 [Sarcophaga bullata]
MPAVVRVKRRIDEEPLSSFVLNGKRRRMDEEENMASAPFKDEISTLLKFAGTIKEQDDTATTQFARLTKDEAKELVLQKSQRPLNATDKARQEMREHQQEQRFRVVNRLRTTLDADDNANDRSKEITIVDIEKHTTNVNKTATDEVEGLDARSAALASMISNLNEASTSAAAAAAAAAAITMPTDSDTGYVYDLYIPENEQQADYVDLMDDNYLRICPFDDLVYEDRYNDDQDDSFDSEDSNDENHAGNEYPDEDDDAALNSDRENYDEDAGDPRNLSFLLERVVLDDHNHEDEDEVESEFEYDDTGDSDSPGSTTTESDAGNELYVHEDPYCHVLDPEDDSFLNDVDVYGLAYARYKARVMRQSKQNDGELDDEQKSNNSDSSEQSI